jgi:oxygen-independent coproporphyrinogen-3 oxidase
MALAASFSPGGSPGAQAQPLGVYVHFPWCLQKCPYCDFLSIPSERQDIPQQAYTEAVLSELEARRRASSEREVRSIFFGGGTPSLWEAKQLGRVIQRVKQLFPVAQNLEVTAECNPSSFDRTVAERLLESGVNRFSLGVQGLHDERLQFLGRLHDAQGGLRAVRDALASGAARVSADLIFGVHGQSVDEAVREACTVAELGVTHLSVYALTIEEGTSFGTLHRKGRLPLLDEDTAARMFLALGENLERHGFEHYEISNYARDGHYSTHNLGYWQGRDYLGLGCGAWGTLSNTAGGLRYRNTRSIDHYLASSTDWAKLDLTLPAMPSLRPSLHRPLVEQVETIDAVMRLSERILLGLRLKSGLDLDEAANQCGAVAWTAERSKTVDRLVARGRLLKEGSRIRIAQDAWLFADATISELL